MQSLLCADFRFFVLIFSSFDSDYYILEKCCLWDSVLNMCKVSGQSECEFSKCQQNTTLADPVDDSPNLQSKSQAFVRETVQICSRPMSDAHENGTTRN